MPVLKPSNRELTKICQNTMLPEPQLFLNKLSKVSLMNSKLVSKTQLPMTHQVIYVQSGADLG